MTDQADWLTTFPSAGAADLVRQQFDRYLERIEELRRDSTATASLRDALSGRGWRARIDLTGVPHSAIEAAQRHVEIAWDALRDPVQLNAARQALLTARAQFSPSRD